MTWPLASHNMYPTCVLPQATAGLINPPPTAGHAPKQAPNLQPKQLWPEGEGAVLLEHGDGPAARRLSRGSLLSLPAAAARPGGFPGSLPSGRSLPPPARFSSLSTRRTGRSKSFGEGGLFKEEDELEHIKASAAAFEALMTGPGQAAPAGGTGAGAAAEAAEVGVWDGAAAEAFDFGEGAGAAAEAFGEGAAATAGPGTHFAPSFKRNHHEAFSPHITAPQVSRKTQAKTVCLGMRRRAIEMLLHN